MDHPSATNRTALVVDREDGRGLDAAAVAAAAVADITKISLVNFSEAPLILIDRIMV